MPAAWDFILLAVTCMISFAAADSKDWVRGKENCKVQGKGVRSMFSVNDRAVKSALVGRKMDQTPTLQFAWRAVGK